MSSDYQNIMALLLKSKDNLQADHIQNDSEAEDGDLPEQIISLFQDIKSEIRKQIIDYISYDMIKYDMIKYHMVKYHMIGLNIVTA